MNSKNNTQLHTNLSELQQLFETYISDCEYTKNLRWQTIKSYREVFSTFQKLLPDIKDTSDLEPHQMNEFYKLLSTRERIVGKGAIKIGVKPSTIRTYHNKLIAFFSWLENYNHIEKGSFVRHVTKPPLPTYEDEKALSDQEVSKIIASITLHSIDNPFMFKRDILIVMLFLYTGIRKGELIGLRIQDIDFENHTLYVFEKTSKSKKSRYIPLHHALIKHLKVYLKKRKTKKLYTDALIVSLKQDRALTHYGLVHWVRKYKQLSGVKFHVHQFRHTFACTLAKQNADLTSIMRVLGHSSIQMTARYLRSITAENSRSFIEKITY